MFLRCILVFLAAIIVVEVESFSNPSKLQRVPERENPTGKGGKSRPSIRYHGLDRGTRDFLDITNINDCPYLASIQRAPGFQSWGCTAVFVAAAWVLSNDDCVSYLTDDGDRKKSIVVMSNSVDHYWERDGKVHRVKQIVFNWDFELAMVKTAGENHGFIPPVSPNWSIDPARRLHLFFFDPLQDEVNKFDDVYLLPSSSCYADSCELCIDSRAFTDCEVTYGAALIDPTDRRLVGMLYGMTFGEGDYEWFDRVSSFSGWIRDVVEDKHVYNVGNDE